MPLPQISEKQPKNNKLRNNEYYGTQRIYDNYYLKAIQNQKFEHLMDDILSKANILLAFRNIKRNTGSKTPSADKQTIDDIKNLAEEQAIERLRKMARNYHPKVVRRKEIPKPNGKTRPLGIPAIWDRLFQQAILQVLEPICEAHFYEKSFGFRPNRSPENAIAECATQINHAQRTYVVDVDIKGFFDEVNHKKLMRQLWTLGIHDKWLLYIVRQILKAPIRLESGKILFPTKGTPQGGILSPLLANINLNELDWWVAKQWNEFETKRKYTRKDYKLEKLKKSNLKPMYIIRYADDFKIFTNNRSNANKIYQAVQQFLEERLKLPMSKEKSCITNLKKHESEFLGFSLRADKKGKRKDKTKFVMHSQMSKKAKRQQYLALKEQIIRISKSPNSLKAVKEIGKYNSIVIGMHNYYKIATHVGQSVSKNAFWLSRVMYNRFPKSKDQKGNKNTNGFTKVGKYSGKDQGYQPYLKSEQVRYLMKIPILPLAYVKTKNARMKQLIVNKYTEEGRKLIHKQLSDISESELAYLRTHPIEGVRGTIEVNDNRISLYVAQKGKCAITGKRLMDYEWHCHHKKMWSEMHDDSYKNLVLILSDVHRLIHATVETTILKYLNLLKLDKEQLGKLNQLRKLVGNTEILKMK
ncbi:group II intron reverse transcriptase/maturase [Lactococcus lactis]|uniref:Group II intron reverse transcriptase/maturase n=1 Tax=Lactococcus lactis TaxID=1358 RepID=A0A9X4NI69_9LACT|nr:group II intron reverse transcriptase/maturase [Lactococcus lactis]MDG4983874.1 group II intron reverse transcriptase/maturase [Lactococcus lactis]